MMRRERPLHGFAILPALDTTMLDRMVRFTTRFLLLTTFLAVADPAAALDSGWATTEGARMRLLVDPARTEGGMISGVLDIELEPGWKTYWIDPGGSGIPPTVDVSASQGIALDAMRLPAPVHVDDGYSVFAGYTQSVRFVLEFSAPAAAQLEANVFIGVCEKICIPFQSTFSLPIPGPDSQQTAGDETARAVASARRALPDMPGEDFSVAKPRFDAEARMLTVSVTLPADQPADAVPDLFISGQPDWAFAPPRLEKRDGRAAVFTVPVGLAPKDAATRARPLDLVVTYGPRAIEAKLPAE